MKYMQHIESAAAEMEAATRWAADPERGDWSNTATGRAVYLEDPRVEDVDPLDIAESLARICRFNGHLRSDVEHYSVAQHSVIVSYACEPRHALIGLLHDAHEAYMHDIVRPARGLLGDDWKRAESRWQAAVRLRFGLPVLFRIEAWGMHVDVPADVKRADLAVLATERRDLINHRGRPWAVSEAPLAERILPMRAFDARDLFLTRLAELTHDARAYVP